MGICIKNGKNLYYKGILLYEGIYVYSRNKEVYV